MNENKSNENLEVVYKIIKEKEDVLSSGENCFRFLISLLKRHYFTLEDINKFIVLLGDYYKEKTND